MQFSASVAPLIWSKKSIRALQVVFDPVAAAKHSIGIGAGPGDGDGVGNAIVGVARPGLGLGDGPPPAVDDSLDPAGLSQVLPQGLPGLGSGEPSPHGVPGSYGSWQRPLDRVFLDTLANAVLAASEESLPDAQEADLAVDVEFDPAIRRYTLIVSETSMGGLGLIEALHRDYAQDPRKFWEAVGRACAPTEAEEVDQAMQDVPADLTDPANPIAQSVAAFRGAAGIAQMDNALDSLLTIWTETDGPPGHLLVSTLAARLLRPGSTPTIDHVVADLATAWTQQEARLRVEIDARTLVFHAAQGDLGFRLAPLSSDAAFSLLWLRGPQARLQRLGHWHPYRDDVVVERLTLESVVRDTTSTVDVIQPDWLEDYIKAIENDGRVVLTAPYPHRATLAECIRQATVTAAERNGLRVYGRVSGIHQQHGTLQASLSLAEEPQ